jgi:hypothetical protein
LTSDSAKNRLFFMNSTPSRWTQEIVDLYESGAASQFIVCGNIHDRYLISTQGKSRLSSLTDYIKEALLTKFDVILRYDLGNGCRVDKGGEIFAQWPAYKDKALPTTPRESIHVLTHYLRFCANLARLKPDKTIRVAILIENANLIVPSSPGSANYELSAIASQLRDWSTDPAITETHCATFLLSENLNDLHPLLANNPQSARIIIPLPQAEALRPALDHLAMLYPLALAPFSADLAQPAAALAGASLHSIETLLQQRQHHKQALQPADLITIKKELVEKDANGLIEFLKPDRTLDDLYGIESIKTWLRQDIALWKQGDLAAMPMGYLFCGPVGTGKTFLVECLAGEAGVPVVKMKNFRDKWVGSTESNLEKIFRLLEALGRCIVFVDEADQALGRRNADSGDSGVNGRIYGMMAEQMSNSRNRGKILWALATSRPDLVEVDLKRPGRIDVKIPLFPTTTPQESYALVRALCKRRQVQLPESMPAPLEANMPNLLTPGAAEALAVKVYRMLRTAHPEPLAALEYALQDYQAPVAPEIIAEQIKLAVAEATDLSFVPAIFR